MHLKTKYSQILQGGILVKINNSYNKYTYTNNYNSNAKNSKPGANVTFGKAMAKETESLYEKLTGFVGKPIGKYVIFPIAKNPKVQKFILKLKDSKNFYTHLSVADSVVLTSFYMFNTNKNKDIKKDQKLPLIINQGLVTVLSAILTYSLNNSINKKIDKFTGEFKKVLPEALKTAKYAGKNLSDEMIKENVGKMGGGIKKLQSVFIFTLIYRYISPVIITPIANRISEKIQNDKKQNKTPEQQNSVNKK